MKILYGIQSTGNGHITRAIELIPYLMEWGDLDVLLSGSQSDIEMPFKVKYRFNGLSFVFGKQGGVDVWNTYWNMKTMKLMKEINNLPIEKYDLIISDFEPVTAWASLKAGRVCVGLSNQMASMHPLAPSPKKIDLLGKLILSQYAPCSIAYGFHFKSLDQHIFTPIIRKEIRELTPSNEGHYTVYLPAYSDEKIIKSLSQFEKIRWEVFSKHNKKKFKEKNISIQPINNGQFVKSLVSCEGVLCNAGFGTTSEALFLQKKLLVIPMKNQYEQHCNAAMLKSMGVHVIKKLGEKNHEKIGNWLSENNTVQVDYPDNAREIVDLIVRHHGFKPKKTAIPETITTNLFQNL